MLIDLGATHSFALPAFIRKIKKVSDVLNGPFGVTIPYGEVLNSKQLVKACEVSISDHKLCVELIILEMHDYDVILGIDWLSKHCAKIDCKKKEVTFQLPQKESFTFNEGCKEKRMAIISALKAARLFKGECGGYLESVVIEKEEQRPKLKDIPIVNGFPEVFPEEILRVSLDQEINFIINLLLRTA